MNIVQFVAAEIIILLFINSVEKVISTIDSIYDVLTALDKIGYVTDLELDKNTGAAITNADNGLSVMAEQISFGFPGEKKKKFNQLSFHIDSNEKVILTGPSGSGKSLLLQLIAGIHQIESGELYINDVPYSNYQKDNLFNSLGVLFPTNQIFEGTIRENILMGRPVSDNELAEITKLLYLDAYIIHQPLGIETLVDSGGRRLPQSIIQKILIARTIIDKPKLLLMEDPLQFIAAEEKTRIVDYIMDKKRDWTVLVVSDFNYWKDKSERIINLPKLQG